MHLDTLVFGLCVMLTFYNVRMFVCIFVAKKGNVFIHYGDWNVIQAHGTLLRNSDTEKENKFPPIIINFIGAKWGMTLWVWVTVVWGFCVC